MDEMRLVVDIEVGIECGRAMEDVHGLLGVCTFTVWMICAE